MIAGLYAGEVVLLVLGVALFIVLLGALRKALSAGKSYAGLLPFFLVTIAMIGYPSIRSIQYKEGMLEIDTDTSKVENAGSDAESAKEAALRLQQTANNLKGRANAADQAKIERALAAVQQWQQRNAAINKNTGPANGNQDAVIRERVLKLTAELKQAEAPGNEGGNPQGAARKKQLRDDLEQAVKDLERLPASPENAEAISSARRLLATP